MFIIYRMFIVTSIYPFQTVLKTSKLCMMKLDSQLMMTMKLFIGCVKNLNFFFVLGLKACCILLLLLFSLTLPNIGSSRMFRHPRTTWHYINACLRSSGRTSDGIRIVRGLSEVSAQMIKNYFRFLLCSLTLAQNPLRQIKIFLEILPGTPMPC